MHVYIVDDDQDLATTMQILLKRHGHEVQAFSSASSFLETMPSLPPGCILLDVRMPGMDGLSLRQELIQSGSPHQIILSSGAGGAPSGDDADTVEFLAKPYRSKDLISLISKAEQRIKS
jgi:two-component system response regulator FixJ